jgi:hypothetical protein
MTDNLPPDPFPGGIPPLGFSELRNPFQELIDRAEREHAIMQFFGAIFGCMESEQVSLSRAIADGARARHQRQAVSAPLEAPAVVSGYEDTRGPLGGRLRDAQGDPGHPAGHHPG